MKILKQMNITPKTQTVSRTALGGLALFAALFGAYLIYEKVYLSLLTAQTDERAGIIQRADDPLFFWLWVATYALAGMSILIAGVFTLRAVVNHSGEAPKD